MGKTLLHLASGYCQQNQESPHDPKKEGRDLVKVTGGWHPVMSHLDFCPSKSVGFINERVWPVTTKYLYLRCGPISGSPPPPPSKLGARSYHFQIHMKEIEWLHCCHVCFSTQFVSINLEDLLGGGDRTFGGDIFMKHCRLCCSHLSSVTTSQVCMWNWPTQLDVCT